MIRARRRGQLRDVVAELAPAREWLVDVKVYRGLVDRLLGERDVRGTQAIAGDDTHVHVVIAVNATRRTIAERAASRRVERLGIAVFEAAAR